MTQRELTFIKAAQFDKGSRLGLFVGGMFVAVTNVSGREGCLHLGVVKLRMLSKGLRSVAELGLAVSEQFRSRTTNETREIVTFVDVTVWGKVAENCGQYLTKGRPIFVEGRLVLDSWEDKFKIFQSFNISIGFIHFKYRNP